MGFNQISFIGNFGLFHFALEKNLRVIYFVVLDAIYTFFALSEDT